MKTYVIKPAVDPWGMPTYQLSWVWRSGFSYGEKLIATNSDRAVLERAIEHLNSDEYEDRSITTGKLE